MRVLFVRHGDVGIHDELYGRTPGIHLSPEGRLQVERLAPSLVILKPVALYSSPLDRAMETSSILGERLALPIIPDDRLLEFDFGAWAGKPFRDLDLDPAWPLFNTFRSGAICPGGERVIDVQSRMLGLIADLATRHGEEEAVVLVSHADVIRSILCYYLSIPIDLALRLEISVASCSVMELQPYGPKLLSLNAR
jgi:ribonuclease H / adenosylcobalamin/alpha-ribazole phosphatase